MKYSEIKQYARNLRNNPTRAEAKLWPFLRKRQVGGRKFLRQHPVWYQIDYRDIYYFIPDFFCYQEKMIIELDGEIHDFQMNRDKRRQAILENAGFIVLRFRNEELEDIPKVLARIESHFSDQISPSPGIREGD